MNWQRLKDKIYYCDGSFRDIYVHNTTKDDWQIWADFVNQNYSTSFHIHDINKREDKVDLTKIFDYWTGKYDSLSTATVFLGDIQLNAHFFTDKEIENDITPKEFNSIADHYKLVKYMVGLSIALDKRVILTLENTPEVILISVDKDNVEINLD